MRRTLLVVCALFAVAAAFAEDAHAQKWWQKPFAGLLRLPSKEKQIARDLRQGAPVTRRQAANAQVELSATGSPNELTATVSVPKQSNPRWARERWTRTYTVTSTGRGDKLSPSPGSQWQPAAAPSPQPTPRWQHELRYLLMVNANDAPSRPTPRLEMGMPRLGPHELR